MTLTAAQLLNAGAAGLVVVLGALVLHALRHRPGRAFAAFLLGAAGLFASSLPLPVGLGRPLLAASRLLAAGGLLVFLLAFPKPIERGERRLVAAALGGAGLVSVVAEGPLDAFAQAWRGEPDPVWLILGGLTDLAADSAIVAAIFLLPLRARRLGPAEAAAARSLALLATGIMLFLMGNGQTIATAARGGFPLVQAVLFAAWSTAATLLWAVAARGAHARLARNVAVGSGVVFGTGVLIGVADTTLVFPIGRVLGAGLLAYALLRGEIEGLDVKVRFAISKSTIAAVFIAVFFVASEAAQQFFGEQFDSGYLGILAAGALVFAIAPLSRLADRLAERAVPVATPSTPSARVAGADARALRVYERALRTAIGDGRITPEEEEHLAHIAHEMGIPHPEALQVRRAVEHEAERRAAGGEP